MTDQRQRQRLARLREELADEAMPLSLPGPAGDALLEELDYAMHPAVHEGVAPRYGAIVSAHRGIWPERFDLPASVAADEIELPTLRRLADGRSSFVYRAADDDPRVVFFDHSVEYEADAVRLSAAASVYVIQRSARGRVRICGPDGVAVWEGARWWLKPLAPRLAASVTRVVDKADPDVVAGLAELTVHWLSAGRVGATLVMALDDGEPIGHMGTGAAVEVPRLSVTRRSHFAPLLSLLSQVDRAAPVSATGDIDTVGVALRWSHDTARSIGPYRGTRHTAAKRFSHDEPGTVVFVVSAAGPVSVFHGGLLVSMATEISRTDASLHDNNPLAGPVAT
jgi:hypothetical protein